jgi:hypothetical protein
MSGLIFYMHDGPDTFRFELSGSLTGADVNKLDQAWRTASSTFGGKALVVDITFLTEIDERGRDLLARWSRANAYLVANTEKSRHLAEQITGRPYTASDAAAGPTFHPAFTSSAFRAVAVAAMLTVTLLFPATASAGGNVHQLKPETLEAWNQNLSTATAHMKDRARGTFLWTDESPERLRRVRAGEVLVEPMANTPQAVPGGLIHHWIGAAYIPGARIDDAITVVRNYNRYPEFYSPSVIEAKTLSRKAGEDRFLVVVVDKAMFMSHALDSEYHSRFVEVDERKWYNIAETTSVQEVAEGGPMPDGEGSGYIWRLCTVSRYEERDGGVYIETEAYALSRPIPFALHWVVDPIVRRVSRSALAKSIEQTRDATGSFVKSEAALTASGRRHAASLR